MKTNNYKKRLVGVLTAVFLCQGALFQSVRADDKAEKPKELPHDSIPIPNNVCAVQYRACLSQCKTKEEPYKRAIKECKRQAQQNHYEILQLCIQAYGVNSFNPQAWEDCAQSSEIARDNESFACDGMQMDPELRKEIQQCYQQCQAAADQCKENRSTA